MTTLAEAVAALTDLARNGNRRGRSVGTPAGRAWFIEPEEWEAIAYAAAVLGMFAEAMEADHE